MTSRRTPRPLTTLLRAAAVVAALVCVSPVASANVIRLRSGETIKGRAVQERSNEEVLVVEDYLSGATRELAWDAVDPADATHLRRLWNLEGSSDLSVPCDLLEYRLDDGSVTVIKGQIVKEEGGFTYVKNRSQNVEALKLVTGRIVSRTKAECDPTEIATPEELVAQRRKEQDPQDARTWLLFAQYAEAVTAWAAAKEGYENAAADETFLNREVAKAGVARVEAILRDSEALKSINDLKTALSANQWKRVREGIEGFAAKHPTASEPVKKKVETLKTEYGTRRTKWFSDLAGRRIEAIVRGAIKKRVSARDTEYNAIQGWIRKEAVDEALASLLADMQRHDPAVTVEEAKTFFEGRPKKVWRSAKYGAGSRFVEPPKVMPKTGTKQPQQPNQGGGPAPVMKLPEPPTRDEWWKDLATDPRVEFWWAVFVEKSGLFEIDQKKGKIPCDRCDGEGALPFSLSNGMAGTRLCPRCGGARYDLVVKFR